MSNGEKLKEGAEIKPITGVLKGEFTPTTQASRVYMKLPFSYVDKKTSETKNSISQWFDLNNEFTDPKINKDFSLIADKLGVKEESDKIEADSFEDYLKKLIPLFQGKFAYFVIKGEEELNTQDSKVYPKRYIKNWKENVESNIVVKAVEGYTLNVTGNIHVLSSPNDKPISWDKNNNWDFKRLVKPDAEIQEGIASKNVPTDDLPF